MLLDPASLREALLEWLPVLERILGSVALKSAAAGDSTMDGAGEERWDTDYLSTCSDQREYPTSSSEEPTDVTEKNETPKPEEEEGQREDQLKLGSTKNGASNGSPAEPVRVVPPKPIPSDLLAHLCELATLYTELSCFRNQNEQELGCTVFLRRYFFLLDQERVRRMCLLCHQEQPEIMSSFTEAMLGQTIILENLHVCVFSEFTNRQTDNFKN